MFRATLFGKAFAADAFFFMLTRHCRHAFVASFRCPPLPATPLPLPLMPLLLPPADIAAIDDDAGR